MIWFCIFAHFELFQIKLLSWRIVTKTNCFGFCLYLTKQLDWCAVEIFIVLSTPISSTAVFCKQSYTTESLRICFNALHTLISVFVCYFLFLFFLGPILNPDVLWSSQHVKRRGPTRWRLQVWISIAFSIALYILSFD